jgi:hypothetical protein
MYYWQKDPIKETWGFGGFKVKWQLRFNPIWRIQQWWYTHKGITYGKGTGLGFSKLMYKGKKV